MGALHKQSDIPAAAAAEAPVLTDVNRREIGKEAAQVIHKVIRFHRRKFPGKSFGDHSVQTRHQQPLHFSVDGLDQVHRSRGIEQAARVGIKGQRCRRAPTPPGRCDRGFQHRTMAEMHAIKHAHRQVQGPARQVLRGNGQLRKVLSRYLHSAIRGAT